MHSEEFGEIKKGCGALSGHQEAGQGTEGRFSSAGEVTVSKFRVRRQIKMKSLGGAFATCLGNEGNESESPGVNVGSGLSAAHHSATRASRAGLRDMSGAETAVMT